MNIIKVELDEQPIDPKFGVPEDYTSFIITEKDPDDPDAALHYLRAQNDPRTELYQEVHKWYVKQKNPGFEFRFKKPPKS